jgi:Protein of unknown function DUF262
MDILDEFDNVTGLEATEASESEAIDNNYIFPFDPKQIKITVETVTIYGIVMRLRHDKIDLYPKFQRKANLWDNVRKSRLIESLLLRFPLPAFYFDIENEDKWLVVDGLQRLSTLNHFILDTKNPLILEGLEILKDLEGKTFKKLDFTLRQRILDTNLTTFQIQAGTPKALKYNLFKRINTGGLGLTAMEIRHALNQKGVATSFFERLTGNQERFFNAFVQENSIPTARMEDRELILRYVAFSLTPYEDYKPSLGHFLDKAMEKLDTLSEKDCDTIVYKLQKSIKCYENIFGNTRFGRGLTRRAQMNSALFEAWATELSRISEEEQQQLVYNREKLKTDYQMDLQQ